MDFVFLGLYEISTRRFTYGVGASSPDEAMSEVTDAWYYKVFDGTDAVHNVHNVPPGAHSLIKGLLYVVDHAIVENV